MNSRHFRAASEISTNCRCDNCGILISQIAWKRCALCKAFDLCTVCGDIVYDELHELTLQKHRQLHPNRGINGNSLQLVSIEEVDKDDSTTRDKRREAEYQRIVHQKKINNDEEMSIIMNKLIKHPPSKDDPVNSLIVQYHLTANERKIHILSLDGGGIRGYIPIKVLTELITQKYLPDIPHFDVNNVDHRNRFSQVQGRFSNEFDYFFGACTGALVAFCLAVNYDIFELIEIYSNAKRYFKRNRFRPWICSKCDPSMIHKKIDEIIDQVVFPGNRKISAEHVTLLDIRNLLNPSRIITDEQAALLTGAYGHLLESVDPLDRKCMNKLHDLVNDLRPLAREKALLIPAYNIDKECITIFNSSDVNHWNYRIADILKATIAAPSFFSPHKIKQNVHRNENFLSRPTSDLFIGSGAFGNAHDLAVRLAIRMQQINPSNHYLFSIGTGTNTTNYSTVATPNAYLGWLFNKKIPVNRFNGAAQRLKEDVEENFGRCVFLERMKLDYDIVNGMDQVDPNFVPFFDEEWSHLKDKADYHAFVGVVEKYILHQAQCEGEHESE